MLQIALPKGLYLIQGVPGSGKSTVARMLKSALELDPLGPGLSDTLPSITILSTDDHRYDAAGHYFCDPKDNADFHARTQRACADAMREGTNYIIIDNTNILKEHAYPYVALGKMYGYDVQVIRVDPGLAEAKRRNSTRTFDRRVPNEIIEQMHASMEQLL